MANHFALGWGLDKVPIKIREIPNLKSSIIDYQNQKEEKYSKKKLFEQKDHELFFDYNEKKSESSFKLPKIGIRLPPGFQQKSLIYIFFFRWKNSNLSWMNFVINSKNQHCLLFYHKNFILQVLRNVKISA